MTRPRWRVALPIALLAVTVATLTWLVATESGLHWLLARAPLPAELTLDTVAGRIVGSITVRELRYRNEQVALTARDVALSWQPTALLVGSVHITALTATDVDVRFPEATAKKNSATRPPRLLPLRLAVGNATLRSVRVGRARKDWIALDTLSLSGSFDGHVLRLADASARTPMFVVTAHGAAGVVADAETDLGISWRVTPTDMPAFQGGGTVRGNLKTLVVAQQLTAPFAATLNGNVNDLLTGPTWQGRLALAPASLQSVKPAWPQAMLSADIDAGGTFETFSARGEVRATKGATTDALGTGTPPWNVTAKFSAQRTPGVWTLEHIAAMGKWHEQTVSADARGRIQGERYELAAFNARAGSARASAAGSVDKSWDGRWQIEIPAIATLLPQAGGALSVSGQVRGARNGPAIAMRARGNNLALGERRLRALAADARIDLSEHTSSQVDVSATRLAFDGYTLAKLALTGTGKLSAHTLRITAELPHAAIALGVAGDYRDLSWRGSVRATDVRSARAGHWRLARPAALRISREAVALEQLCLHANAARLCAHGDWRAAQASTAHVVATALPLSLLDSFFTRDLETTGTVTGAASVRTTRDTGAHGDADFTVTAGSVRSRVGATDLALRYDGARLRAAANGDGLRADMDIDLPGADVLRAHVRLPQFNSRRAANTDQPIAGDVMVAIANIAPFAALTPDLDTLQGRLDVKLALSGTVNAPRVSGRAALDRLAARIVPLGIHVHDGTLALDADGAHSWRIAGAMQSDTGNVTVAGRLDLLEKLAWRARLALKGERFQIANLREARIWVSPDIALTVQPGRVDVEGEVRIPQAVLAPRPPTQSVPISTDVVFVNETPQDRAQSRRWDVSARVRLLLGDDVTFEGFGLSGNIGGNVVVVEAPEQITTGRGELRIENGKYEAYGQKLEIERGRLLFAGGALDNPGMDARAIRKIDDITAGVRVRGTLKSPELTLFSEPTMGESDVLSYLLLGRPLRQASTSEGRLLARAATSLGLSGGEFLAQRIGARFGLEEVAIESGNTPEQASLVIGKRLSPKLYVNYSIGLFEQVNQIRLRYQLTKRWALQAESGTYSGADLLYTIER